MNQEKHENLPPSGGLNASSHAGEEATPCIGPSPDSSKNDVAKVDVPVVTGSRAARNRRERERKQRRRAENRRTLALEKAKGCWLCMRRHLAAEKLHFHHLDPKKKRDCVAHLINRSVSTFLEEICECRLICCDCHKQHHAVLHSEAWRKGGCYDL